MPEPIRVAFVDHTARLGGGERSLLRLIVHLDRDTVEPTVVLGEEGPLEDELRRHGIAAVVCPFGARLGETRKDTLGLRGIADPARAADAAGATRRLRRELAARRTEIVHTNSLKAHLIGGLAGRLSGARVLWHVRDRLAPPYLPRAAAVGMRAAARTIPHAVVVASRTVAETVGRGDERVLRHGVDVPPARPARAGGPRSVGIVGRIAPWKGQDVFLAAAELVARTHPDVEWIVAGAPLFGEEDFERQLRCRVAARGPERTRFLGHCDDVWPVYASLDVAVHASTQPEPYGNVVLEAMASGVAVLASDAGGPAELVEDGVTGRLVRPGDPAALAAAVVELLDDDAARRRLADAGRAWVSEELSPERDARTVEHLYRELLA